MGCKLIDRLLKRPYVYISSYVYHMRMLEKYSRKDIRYYWHYYRYRTLSYKLGFQISPGTIGSGLKLYHWGTIIITGDARIGKNCTIYPGVTVGKGDHGSPIIGDNCFLGLGAKIYGNITVGSNVMVLPNAVVTKDVPDNCIVAGVPAKIIRYLSNQDE